MRGAKKGGNARGEALERATSRLKNRANTNSSLETIWQFSLFSFIVPHFFLRLLKKRSKDPCKATRAKLIEREKKKNLKKFHYYRRKLKFLQPEKHVHCSGRTDPQIKKTPVHCLLQILFIYLFFPSPGDEVTQLTHTLVRSSENWHHLLFSSPLPPPPSIVRNEPRVSSSFLIRDNHVHIHFLQWRKISVNLSAHWKVKKREEKK